mmetsp:Transcript_15628/g.40301  ORF Transcript_15628/g.40301 Transcript_15628/m.40301 type:complete len:218 (+) Transcript_15628:271-924(+)
MSPPPAAGAGGVGRVAFAGAAPPAPPCAFNSVNCATNVLISSWSLIFLPLKPSPFSFSFSARICSPTAVICASTLPPSAAGGAQGAAAAGAAGAATGAAGAASAPSFNSCNCATNFLTSSWSLIFLPLKPSAFSFSFKTRIWSPTAVMAPATSPVGALGRGGTRALLIALASAFGASFFAGSSFFFSLRTGGKNSFKTGCGFSAVAHNLTMPSTALN